MSVPDLVPPRRLTAGRPRWPTHELCPSQRARPSGFAAHRRLPASRCRDGLPGAHGDDHDGPPRAASDAADGRYASLRQGDGKARYAVHHVSHEHPGDRSSREVRRLGGAQRHQARMARLFDTPAKPRLFALQEASAAQQMATADMYAAMSLGRPQMSGPMGAISGAVMIAPMGLQSRRGGGGPQEGTGLLRVDLLRRAGERLGEPLARQRGVHGSRGSRRAYRR